MAGLSVFNQGPYNTFYYNEGPSVVIITPAEDRPAQATISGQPTIHSTRLDPLLMFRPEGRPLRVIREAQREVERRLRE
jgi:hypothetical protein